MATLLSMRNTIYKNGRVMLFIMFAYLAITAYYVGKNGLSGDSWWLVGCSILFVLYYLFSFERPFIQVKDGYIHTWNREFGLIPVKIKISSIISVLKNEERGSYGVPYSVCEIHYENDTGQDRKHKFPILLRDEIYFAQFGFFIRDLIQQNPNIQLDDDFEKELYVGNVVASILESYSGEPRLELEKFLLQYKPGENFPYDDIAKSLDAIFEELSMEGFKIDTATIKTKALEKYASFEKSTKSEVSFIEGPKILKGRKRTIYTILAALLAVLIRIVVDILFAGK